MAAAGIMCGATNRHSVSGDTPHATTRKQNGLGLGRSDGSGGGCLCSTKLAGYCDPTEGEKGRRRAGSRLPMKSSFRPMPSA